MNRRILMICALLLCLCACGRVPGPSLAGETAIPENTAKEAEISLPVSEGPETLTIARIENNRFVSDALQAFNEYREDVQIESQWYNDREGALKLSLIAGDGPELMSLEFFDYEIYAAKGVFENLYPYIDKDPDLSREDLVEPILRAFQWDESTLYQLAPSFQMDCMYTCPAAVDPDLPWNLDTIEAWMTAHPEALFTDSESFEALLKGYLPELVDFGAGTCDFTSGLFARLLRDCMDWDARKWTYGDLDAGAFTSGALMTTWFYLYNFADYQSALDLGLETVSGYPSSEGGQVFAKSVTRFAICAGTGREDIAWDFLKTTLSPELQKDTPWFPMLRSELDARGQQAQREQNPVVTEMFVDPEGAAKGTNPATVTVTLRPDDPMARDEVELVLELMEQAAGYRGNSCAEIMNIIYEEAAACFADDKSPEAVAEIVQNRVEIYLSEQQ